MMKFVIDIKILCELNKNINKNNNKRGQTNNLLEEGFEELIPRFMGPCNELRTGWMKIDKLWNWHILYFAVLKLLRNNVVHSPF